MRRHPRSRNRRHRPLLPPRPDARPTSPPLPHPPPRCLHRLPRRRPRLRPRPPLLRHLLRRVLALHRQTPHPPLPSAPSRPTSHNPPQLRRAKRQRVPGHAPHHGSNHFLRRSPPAFSCRLPLLLPLGLFAASSHRWAAASVPRVVHWLQKRRLILTPDRHRAHHQNGYAGAYCITSGWMNHSLDRLLGLR